MTTKQTDTPEQTDQTVPALAAAAARKVLEDDKLDRQNRAVHKLEAFMQQLQKEEHCIVRAVPFVTPDGRLDAHLAVNALPLE